MANNTLIMNKLFLRDLMDADTPSFAAGYVEELGETSGFFAMRPEIRIPPNCMQAGFSFGHSVQEYKGEVLLHFAFKFYEHETYHCLVQPQNPIIRAVIDKMLETKDYFFFAINTDQTVTAFRSNLESTDLTSLKTNISLFEGMHCANELFEEAKRYIKDNVFPYGEEMNWVCRDNPEYLNIAEFPFALNPR